MKFKFYLTKQLLLSGLLLVLLRPAVNAQSRKTHWAMDGYQYYLVQGNGIAELDTLDSVRKIMLVTPGMLTPSGSSKPLNVDNFFLSDDGKKVLIFTNTKRVWRYNTRDDYWAYDITAKALKQLGKDKPVSSLMFAKLSPDGSKAGYVIGHNTYTEDLATGAVKQLTFNGSKKLINGTFDWV